MQGACSQYIHAAQLKHSIENFPSTFYLHDGIGREGNYELNEIGEHSIISGGSGNALPTSEPAN